MKNKYFRYVLLFLVGILLVSCKKEEKIEVKGREYITESGFSFETTQETKVIETTTEAFDIKKHPEMWSMLDKETCLLVFNRIFHAYSFDFYINKTKMPISQHFLDNYNISSYGLGLINSIEHDDIVEMPHSIEMTDEEFERKEFRFYGGSAGFISRESKFKYLLDNNNKLDEIILIKTDVKDYYAERIAESIANRPKNYNGLERYRNLIPELVLEPKLVTEEYEGASLYYTDDMEIIKSNIEKIFINLEGCTNNFQNKYNPQIGIIKFDEVEFPYTIRDTEENDILTDLENKIIGVSVLIESYDSKYRVENKYIVNNKLINTIDYYSSDSNIKVYKEYNRNFKVHFEVDDRNFLDAITKVEEVLEDGTVVELENNFGK